MKKSTSKEAKPVAPAKSASKAAPVVTKTAVAVKPAAAVKVSAAEPKASKATASKKAATKPAVAEVIVAKPVVVAEVKAASPAKVKAPAKAKAPAATAPAVKLSAAPAVKAAASETLPTTILIAEVDVGFGNTLVVRGEGGGLTWDKGTAMENLGASQWKLVLPSTTTPVVFKFLINDDAWSLGEDYVAVPGSTSSLVPQF